MSLTEEINIASHDTYVNGVPWDLFARLRAEAPVFHHRKVEPEQPDRGFWVISRHADCVKVNRQWESFSSQRKGTMIGEDRPDLELARMMLDLDPPEHTRLRTLVTRGFTPRVIRSMDGHFTDVAQKIIAEAVAKGSFDFVTEVAAELPLIAIAELLGVPVEDRRNLFKWSNTMVGANDPEYAESADLAQGAMTELYMYANELAAARKIEPRGGVVGEKVRLRAREENAEDLREAEPVRQRRVHQCVSAESQRMLHNFRWKRCDVCVAS